MALGRREFLKRLLYAAAATSLAPSAAHLRGAEAVNRSSGVVVVQDAGATISPREISSPVVYRMLGKAICALRGRTHPREAWLSLFKPGEKIGIKVNSLGGRLISTRPELAYAVARHLTASGIPARDIIIWDRLSSELQRAGYLLSRNGGSVQCFGTDHAYDNNLDFSGSVGSCFSRILTDQCDALISIPVLKDHDLSGVSLSLKNFYGAIHNPNKYHANGCDPFIADLNSHDHIKNRLRLIIIDGLIAQCDGGPAYKEQWSWPFGGLIMSTDPVAADRTGSRIVEERRKNLGLPSLAEAGRSPVHIHTAALRHLGVDRVESINTIVL